MVALTSAKGCSKQGQPQARPGNTGSSDKASGKDKAAAGMAAAGQVGCSRRGAASGVSQTKHQATAGQSLTDGDSHQTSLSSMPTLPLSITSSGSDCGSSNSNISGSSTDHSSAHDMETTLGPFRYKPVSPRYEPPARKHRNGMGGNSDRPLCGGRMKYGHPGVGSAVCGGDRGTLSGLSQPPRGKSAGGYVNQRMVVLHELQGLEQRVNQKLARGVEGWNAVTRKPVQRGPHITAAPDHDVTCCAADDQAVAELDDQAVADPDGSVTSESWTAAADAVAECSHSYSSSSSHYAMSDDGSSTLCSRYVPHAAATVSATATATDTATTAATATACHQAHWGAGHDVERSAGCSNPHPAATAPCASEGYTAPWIDEDACHMGDYDSSNQYLVPPLARSCKQRRAKQRRMTDRPSKDGTRYVDGCCTVNMICCMRIKGWLNNG